MMVKPMTLEDYLSNPAGKGSNTIMNRELIMKDLEQRYDVIQSRNDRKLRFSHTLLKDREGVRYVHIIVPSESKERENTYDVVIRFDIPEGSKDVGNDTHLRRHTISVFSNIPSFTYTYAHVFYHNRLLIDDLSKKYEDIVLEKSPDTRNPFYATSYEKSIVFALLHIQNELRMMFSNVKAFDKVAVPWSLNYIRQIRHTDTIKIEYEKERRRIRSRRRKDRPARSSAPIASGKPKGSSATGVNRRVATRPTKRSVRTTKKVGRNRKRR